MYVTLFSTFERLCLSENFSFITRLSLSSSTKMFLWSIILRIVIVILFQ